MKPNRMKEFLILGTVNISIYKIVFPKIKSGEIHPGVIYNKTMDFTVPDNARLEKARADENGVLHCKVQTICWWTNLDNTEARAAKPPVVLTKTYNPEDYPHYDNYDAIEVSRVKDIPIGYPGVMGVPVTFFGVRLTESFKVLGATHRCQKEYKTKVYTDDEFPDAQNLNSGPVLIEGGKPKLLFHRLLIKRRGDTERDTAKTS